MAPAERNGDGDGLVLAEEAVLGNEALVSDPDLRAGPACKLRIQSASGPHAEQMASSPVSASSLSTMATVSWDSPVLRPMWTSIRNVRPSIQPQPRR